MTRRLLNLLTLLSLLLCEVAAGCRSSRWEATHEIFVEVRFPRHEAVAPPAEVVLVTESTASGTPATGSPADDYWVYSFSHFIRTDLRRAVIVGLGRGPAEVFVLDHPRRPQPQSWTGWRPPAYSRASKSGAIWDFMDLGPGGSDATASPSESLARPELRYRVERWKHYEAMQEMRRR